jgi:hypothetical protein
MRWVHTAPAGGGVQRHQRSRRVPGSAGQPRQLNHEQGTLQGGSEFESPTRLPCALRALSTRRDAFGQVGDNGGVAREIAPPHGISKRRMQHSWIFRMLFGASRPRPSRLPSSSGARWERRKVSRCGRPGGPLGHRPSRQVGGPAHSARLPRRSCLAKHYVVVSPDWSGVCAGWLRSCSSLLWMSRSVAMMNA